MNVTPAAGRFLPVGALAILIGGLWRFTRRKPLGALGLALIILMGTLAVFGPLIAPRDPLEQAAFNRFAAPGWIQGNFLGTDYQGRDILSRLILGARTSFTIAVVAVAAGSAIGFFMGLISGYFGGWVDVATQRVIDTLMAIPVIVLALAIVSALGQSTTNVILAIALVQIPQKARVIRSVALTVRESSFVEAARAMGASDWRVIIRHVAPQCVAPAIIVVTASLGTAILVESSLSFLGLGTPPPAPAWGAMLSGQTLENVERAPWNAVFPGIFLTVSVYSFSLLGDALRDVLDPRLRQ